MIIIKILVNIKARAAKGVIKQTPKNLYMLIN